DDQESSSRVRPQITCRPDNSVKKRSSAFGFSKHRDCLLESLDIVCQRLGQIAVSLDRVDGCFVFGAQYFSEEPNGRLLFKLARRIEAAAVVKKHREPNAGFGARQIAEWPQLAVDAKLEIVQLEIDDGVAASIDYPGRNRNKVGADANDVVWIDLVSGRVRCRFGRSD